MERKAINIPMRTEVNVVDLSERLKHKKGCKIGVTKNRNKIMNAINMANELLRSGRLSEDCETEMVTSKERLRIFMENAKKNDLLSWDMETTGLDVFNDVPVGICMYTPNEKAIYVPMNHTDENNHRHVNQLTEEEVSEIVIPFLESGLKSITHNGKFDGKVLHFHWGLDPRKVRWYFDTIIGGHLLNENEPHGLKPLYNKYILKGQGSDEDFGDMFGREVPFNYVPMEVATVYGGGDAYKTYKLFEFQNKYLNLLFKFQNKYQNLENPMDAFRGLSHVMYDIEMPLYPILIEMENKGLEIRPDYAEELAVEMRADLEEAERKLDEFADHFKEEILENSTLKRLTDNGKIGWGSVQQLQAFIFDVLRIPPKRYRGEEDRGTGEENLLWIIEHNKDEHLTGFIKDLLTYRNKKKLLSTYVEKLPRVVEPKTNAVHSNFNQTGTATGRFSSSHPITHINLQNIPSHEKRIRKIFKAREGCYFIGGDYSQIEPRTLASLSKDDAMLESYRQGQDLYANMASIIFDKPVEECKEFRPDGTVNPEGNERRSQTKSVLLGIMYERTAKDIAGQFGKSAKWGEMVMESFTKKFTKVEQCRMKYISMAENLGYIQTVDGRKRRLPDMKLTNHYNYKYQQAHRQVLNAVIQGTAGDIMKKAMVAIGHNERFRELGGQMLLTIHDEVIAEIPKENAKEGAKLMESLMKEVGYQTLGVPMSVDITASDVWYGDEIRL